MWKIVQFLKGDFCLKMQDRAWIRSSPKSHEQNSINSIKDKRRQTDKTKAEGDGN